MTLYEKIDNAVAEGIAESVMQTHIEVAENALAMGFSFEQISILTGLSIEQIENLADEMNLS